MHNENAFQSKINRLVDNQSGALTGLGQGYPCRGGGGGGGMNNFEHAHGGHLRTSLDRRTRLKTLPSWKLRMRAVMRTKVSM